ncbi:MAG: LD-carboxypeptidase [Clostridium sp.]|jgi:muramoyltetrapeptide carboxypeptidase|nr:LD-carboxypeptidase [Clostridium sp.]
MIPPRIKRGDIIGIPSPSKVTEPIRMARSVEVLERMGFSVKLGANIYKDTYGYTASAKERADDFNAFITDPAVKMVFFGGGDAGADILSLLDYDAIRANPKFYSSFSDGTCILNAIYAKTDLITYYGQGPGRFEDLRYYAWKNFETNFMQGFAWGEFIHDTPWKTLHSGRARGTLIGGYPSLFGMMLGTPYVAPKPDHPYILFLEAHEYFDPVAQAASAFALIEHSHLMEQVVGLLVGNYAPQVPETYLAMLARIGEKRQIPVIYCDDFGHGNGHAILPIGADAVLDADLAQLTIFY